MIPLESIYKKNNLTLLNLWAAWCQPCKEEIPLLKKVHQDFNKYGVDVVRVSIDRRGSESMVNSFTNRLNMTYPIFFDPNNDFVRTFKTLVVPELFLINTNGQIVYRWRSSIEGSITNVEKFISGLSPTVSAQLSSVVLQQQKKSIIPLQVYLLQHRQ